MTVFLRWCAAGAVLAFGVFVASLPFLPSALIPAASMALAATAWLSAVGSCVYVAWAIAREGQ